MNIFRRRPLADALAEPLQSPEKVVVTPAPSVADPWCARIIATDDRGAIFAGPIQSVTAYAFDIRGKIPHDIIIDGGSTSFIVSPSDTFMPSATKVPLRNVECAMVDDNGKRRFVISGSIGEARITINDPATITISATGGNRLRTFTLDGGDQFLKLSELKQLREQERTAREAARPKKLPWASQINYAGNIPT